MHRCKDERDVNTTLGRMMGDREQESEMKLQTGLLALVMVVSGPDPHNEEVEGDKNCPIPAGVFLSLPHGELGAPRRVMNAVPATTSVALVGQCYYPIRNA